MTVVPFPRARRPAPSPPPAGDVGSALAWARAALEASPAFDGDAAREAAWIVEAYAGRGASLRPDAPLSPRRVAQVRSDVARRCRGEPLAYVLGTAVFRGLEVAVGPGALIPRPETEGLVDIALEVIGPASLGRRPRVLDAGTGTGCVAIAVALERPDADLVATEVSAAALAYARGNAERLAPGRVEIVEADLRPAVGGPWDLIVSNPPYVPDAAPLPPSVADWEPAIALRAGPDGLAVWRRLLAGVRDRLAPGGAVAGEFGDGQGPALLGLARAAGLAAETRRDLFGKERYLLGRATP